MIQWPSLLFNTLWLLGCAVILAAFSYARWLAQTQRTSTRRLLNTPAFQLPFTLGLTLISLALLLLAHTWPERALWLLFTLLFLFRSYHSWRSQN